MAKRDKKAKPVAGNRLLGSPKQNARLQNKRGGPAASGHPKKAEICQKKGKIGQDSEREIG